MLLDEQFDADEILRDIGDVEDEEIDAEEDMRELSFGNVHDENVHFDDLASDLDNTEDLFE